MKKGQAFITLIIFVAISVIIITAVIVIVGSNSMAMTTQAQSVSLREYAENGIENALIRLLRDTSYTGETIMVDGVTDVVTVTGSATAKTITSVATLNNFQKKIVANIAYTNNVISVVNWQDQ